jgi:intein/homing endonuclease/site-specific recombinase XerD
MKDPTAYLTAEHVRKMIDAEPDPRNQLIIRLLFHGGMRVSELCGALLTDILWKENCLVIPWLKRKRPEGKPHFKRKIPLDSGTMQLLKVWVDQRKKGKIKASDPRIIGLDRRQVYWIVRRAGERVGIDQVGDAANPHFMHPHTLRHCLRGSTWIASHEGMISAIEASGKESLVSLNIPNRALVWGKARKSQHSTEQITRIHAGGYELDVTPEHRLFTLGDKGIIEIQAKTLRKGDWIAGVKSLDMIQASPQFDTPNTARIIGYIVGDGTVSEERHGIILNEKNPAIVEAYLPLLSTWNGREPKVDLRRKSITVTIYSMEKVRMFKSWGWELSPQRRVPSPIMKASKEEIIAYLAGFYDAEGYHYTYCSSSRMLLIDTQMLLLRLGIDSHVHKRERVSTLPNGTQVNSIMYALYVTDQARFKELIPTFKNLPNPTEKHEVIPIQNSISRIIKEWKRKRGRRGISLSQSCKEGGIHDINRYTRLAPEIPTFHKIVTALESFGEDVSYLEGLDKIKWLKITKLESFLVSNETVYDFELPETHTLITNGIISHNSYAVHRVQSTGGDFGKLRKVQLDLGHADINTTAGYLSVSSQELHEEYDKAFEEHSGDDR